MFPASAAAKEEKKHVVTCVPYGVIKAIIGRYRNTEIGDPACPAGPGRGGFVHYLFVNRVQTRFVTRGVTMNKGR